MLARELAGASTPEEEARLERWLAVDPARVRLLALLREAWASSSHLPTAGAAADRDWPKVLTRIRGEHAGPARSPSPRVVPRAGPGGLAQWRGRALGAAAVVLLALAPALLWTRARQRSASPAVSQIVAPTGQVVDVTLPDGSRAVLSSDSRLRYSFTDRARFREVTLEGMAYFDVTGDVRRPFLVRTAASTTRVLGTKFLVREDRVTGRVEVKVAQGRVTVAGGDVVRGGTVLKPGQVGRIEANGTTEVREAAPDDRAPESVRGTLLIQNRSLRHALGELSRWYGVPLGVHDAQLAARSITTSTGRIPLERVLAGIALALDARLQQHGDTIVFIPRRQQGSADSSHPTPP